MFSLGSDSSWRGETETRCMQETQMRTGEVQTEGGGVGYYIGGARSGYSSDKGARALSRLTDKDR